MTNKEAIEILKHDCIRLDKRVGEALEIAIPALEKQIPKEVVIKKINEDIELLYCPNCHVRFIRTGMNCCGNCGQALDWSDDE